MLKVLPATYVFPSRYVIKKVVPRNFCLGMHPINYTFFFKMHTFQIKPYICGEHSYYIISLSESKS